MADTIPAFGPWLKQTLVASGQISPDAEYVDLPPKERDAYLRVWQNQTKAGANFQPSAVAITNPVNTNQVVPFVTTSPNSVQPFPQGRFAEGPVDKTGQQLVFDPMTGTYFPGTNTATKKVVEPKSKAPGMMFDPKTGGFVPIDGSAAATTNALPDSMALTNVASTSPTAGAFETNAPVPVAAMPMGMAPTNAPSMAVAAPAPAAAAPAAVPTAAQVKAAYRAGQITKEQAKQMILMGGR
jgi:hypothetical protein